MSVSVFPHRVTRMIAALLVALLPVAAHAGDKGGSKDGLAGPDAALDSPQDGLPRPLGDFDVAQYQRLFDLQEVGRMKQATREMGRLSDPILMGHLLSQRYLHPTAWRSSYGEL